MTSSKLAVRVIGIDVSKDKLDVSDADGKIKKEIKNSTTSIVKHLVKKIVCPAETFVVCEATGGYERTLVNAMHEAGIPIVHESGKKKGTRAIFGGRSHVRRVLYMATLSATRHNHVIRKFYTSLLARGKEKKVALVACMRKLLTILNEMVRNQEPWRTAPRTKEEKIVVTGT